MSKLLTFTCLLFLCQGCAVMVTAGIVLDDFDGGLHSKPTTIRMKIDTVKSISGYELAYFVEYSDHGWCPHSKLDEDYPNNMATSTCYGGEPVSTPYIKKNYSFKYDTTYYLTSEQVWVLTNNLDCWCREKDPINH